jgi:hypothetical protein
LSLAEPVEALAGLRREADLRSVPEQFRDFLEAAAGLLSAAGTIHSH